MIENGLLPDGLRMVYDRLTLTGVTYLKQAGRQRRRQVQAKCECGNIRFYDYDLIKRGDTKSCGCLKKEVARDQSYKHGLSTHPLYRVWLRLKEKCNNPKSKAFLGYGAKGVRLCQEWNDSYMCFYNWAVDKWEAGLQIDKDKIYTGKFGTKIGLLYSPEYCCFLPQNENKKYTSRSRYIEYNGVRKTLSEWARHLGVNRSVLCNRLGNYGWSEEKTISEPIGKRAKKVL